MKGNRVENNDNIPGPAIGDIDSWVSVITAPSRDIQERVEEITHTQVTEIVRLCRMKYQVKRNIFKKYGRLGKKLKRKTRKRIA